MRSLVPEVGILFAGILLVFRDPAFAGPKCGSGGAFLPVRLDLFRHRKSFWLGMKQPARTPFRSGVWRAKRIGPQILVSLPRGAGCASVSDGEVAAVNHLEAAGYGAAAMRGRRQHACAARVSPADERFALWKRRFQHSRWIESCSGSFRHEH